MRTALVVMLIALVGASTATAKTRARVAMQATAPVTVHGTGFHARERVTVTVSTTGSQTKVVRANAHGVFTVKFTHFAIAHCIGYTVRAKGNRGSLATLSLTPECPPPAGG